MRGPPLGSPLVINHKQSRRNHDAIMIRFISHHWHSASEAPVAGGRRKWRAIKRGPPLGSPPGEQAWRNHDVILKGLMSHHWHAASDALEADG